MRWYLHVLRQYAVFRGRARRMEFWSFTLVSLAIYVALMVLDVILLGGTIGTVAVLSTIYSWGVLVPTLAVTVRRLHDTARSGWWLLAFWLPQVVLQALILSGAIDARTLEQSAGSYDVALGLLGLFLLAYGLFLLVLLCLDGTRGPNRYGPDPKHRGGGAEELWPDVR